MEPKIELAQNYGIREKDLREARNLIEEHVDEIRGAWRKHFSLKRPGPLDDLQLFLECLLVHSHQ